MFDQYWDGDQAIYAAIVVAAIVAIAISLIRTFRRNAERPWPVFFIGLYNVLLLLLYLFGMMTQITSEGFGFVPLMALTTPWSWLSVWAISHFGVGDANLFGNGIEGTFRFSFIVFNVLAGSVNSFVLYFLLKRKQRKQAEDEAWEQARRNR